MAHADRILVHADPSKVRADADRRQPEGLVWGWGARVVPISEWSGFAMIFGSRFRVGGKVRTLPMALSEAGENVGEDFTEPARDFTEGDRPVELR